MMENLSKTSYLRIRELYQTLAESLIGFEFRPLPAGFCVIREGYKNPTGNFVVISPFTSSADAKDTIQKALSTRSFSDEIGIFLPFEERICNEIAKDFSLQLSKNVWEIYHKHKGTPNPWIDQVLDADVTIKSFSFNQRGKKVQSIYEKIELLPGLFNTPSQFSREFERIPRAMLHLFESSFWIMEDYYENFLATAISFIISHSEELHISYLGSPKDLHAKQFRQLLLTNIEMKTGLDEMFIHHFGTLQEANIFEPLNYSKPLSFLMFVHNQES